jgi:hypothetical protein
LKKKPKFGGTHFTKLLYLQRFFYRGKDKMVEKSRAIASKYFGNERLDGKNNSSQVKKGIILCLGGDNLCVKQWNVKYQGLTKNPNYT